jgi:phosphoribosylanthranilate isomerase
MIAMQIKICGITNSEDALACAAAGVDMIGLNFSPMSSRCISPASAAEILAAVRPRFAQTKVVGVFVDQELEFVQKVTTDLALDAIQLHGEETPQYLRKLDAPFVIKALRIGRHSASAPADYKCDAILLDTWSAKSPGGTGEIFPWSVAAALRPHVNRLILAGGLTSGNVADAIRTVRPFAVDVCSDVEDGPGRKDHLKVRRFVAAVRAVEEEKISSEKTSL